jgi:hypothetical protein
MTDECYADVRQILLLVHVASTASSGPNILLRGIRLSDARGFNKLSR